MTALAVLACPATAMAAPYQNVDKVDIERSLAELDTDRSFFYLGVCGRADRQKAVLQLNRRINILLDEYKRLTSREVGGEIVLTEGNGCGAKASRNFPRMVRLEKRRIEIVQAKLAAFSQH